MLEVIIFPGGALSPFSEVGINITGDATGGLSMASFRNIIFQIQVRGVE